jgi:uncharacterized membrane protein YadS
METNKDTKWWLGLIVGLVLVFVLAWCSWQGSAWAVAQGKAMKGFGADLAKSLEYPLWAVVLGLIANGILSALKVKDLLTPAFRTELFIKIGLVLLGTTINIALVLKAGSGGVIQGVFMVTSVFLFTWWLGGIFGLPNTLRAVMAAGISICGVSAAIAAAGAVMAKKGEIAYVTTMIIITAIPLMILMPPLAVAMNLPAPIAGAWFGGNIDTTAAVVGAGTIHSESAAQIASIVKMSQNALMGIVAFLLAFYFVMRVEKKPGERPSARVMWDRFPKFVLGFIVASLLVSIVDAKQNSILFSADALAAMSNLRNWAFTLAFVSIGLSLSLGDIKKIGGKPFGVYLIATIFNTVLALIAAYIIFGVLFPIAL